MSKLIMLATVVSVLSLAACGGKNQSGKSDVGAAPSDADTTDVSGDRTEFLDTAGPEERGPEDVLATEAHDTGFLAHDGPVACGVDWVMSDEDGAELDALEAGEADAAAGMDVDSSETFLGTVQVVLDPFLGETDGCILAADPTDADPAPLAADVLKNAKYFVLKVWTHTPTSAADAPLFDSLVVHGCYKLGGNSIKVQDLEATDTTFILFEGFADSGCGELVMRAARGAVAMAPNETTGPVGLFVCHTLNWPVQ